MQARQGIHNTVRCKDDPRNQRCTDGRTHNAAAHCRDGAVQDKLHGNGAGAVAHGLDGADFRPLLLHHSGHGGQAHQRRHQEEDHREHIRQIRHALGILVVAHKAVVAAPIQYINVRRLDVLDFRLGIVDLLLAVGDFLVSLGLGTRQFLLAVAIFLLTILQLGPVVGKLLGRIGDLGFIFALGLSIVFLALVQLFLAGIILAPAAVNLILRRRQLRLGRCRLGIILLLGGIQLGLSLLQCRNPGCNLRLGLLKLLHHGVIDFLMELQRGGINGNSGCFRRIHLLLLLFQRFAISVHLLLQLRCLGLGLLQSLGLLLQLGFAVLQLLFGLSQLGLGRLPLTVQLGLSGIQLVLCAVKLTPAVVQLGPGIAQLLLSVGHRLVIFFLGIGKLLPAIVQFRSGVG